MCIRLRWLQTTANQAGLLASCPMDRNHQKERAQSTLCIKQAAALCKYACEKFDLETVYMELIMGTHDTAVSIGKRNQFEYCLTHSEADTNPAPPSIPCWLCYC